jgi:opacity protein-like surface antigen
MKKGKLILLAVVAALVLAPAMSWAQAQAPKAPALSEPSFFIELYFGGGGATKQGSAVRSFNRSDVGQVSVSLPGNIDEFVMGGLKFGYWFSPYGTYAVGNLPDWARYFGFYTDFSYQKLTFAEQVGTFRVGRAAGNVNFSTNGNLVTWAFMFAGRYGFFPDSQLPFGRLESYLAVGPAIFFSDQKPDITVTPAASHSPASKSSTNIGLAVETGARYFFNKSISVQLSFKYRYFKPSYDFSGNLPGTTVTYNVNSKPDFNLFSGQLGVAYHF